MSPSLINQKHQQDPRVTSPNGVIKPALGRWWIPVRLALYPGWMAYELSYRFLDYRKAISEYSDQLLLQQGTSKFQWISESAGVIGFVLCTIFLTIPACALLYAFLKPQTRASTKLEIALKRIL